MSTTDGHSAAQNKPSMATSSKAEGAGTVALTAAIRLTKWTAHQPITKHLLLQPDGEVRKTSRAAQLFDGLIERVTCTAKGFLKLLQGIGQNDCLSFGIPKNDSANEVLTKEKFLATGRPGNAMPRTAEAMAWPDGPGILMIDHDAGETKYSPQELLDALYTLCPALKQAAHIWAASASSCLYHADTKQELRGVEGQRVYVVVGDATDIPRAAGVLFKKSWLAGHGYIKVSSAGSLLVRSILDDSVFQTNRIDYCAPAVCTKPLVQRKPRPRLYGDHRLALDTRKALPDLSQAELTQIEKLIEDAKKKKDPEAAETKQAYMAGRTEELIARGVERAQAEKTIQAAMDNQHLYPDFMLHAEDGTKVTVNDLLTDRAKWHGKNFCDPMEPTYHGDQRIARAYLLGGGRPNIHSFAHGGRNYLLVRRTELITLKAGDRSEYADRMVGVLRAQGQFYKRGGSLVAVGSNGSLSHQDEQSVLAALDRVFSFQTFRREKRQLVDAPLQLARHIQKAFIGRFQDLRAVITAPTLDPKSGRLLENSGYDAETCTFAEIPEDWPGIPEHPGLADLKDALKALWWPVRLFPFAEPVDQAVMLTAMLTAVVRPMLPTAPAFAFDAPIQASGKSLLIKVLAALGGSPTAMSPKPDSDNDEEIRKRIFAVLRDNQGAVVFDNITGEFDSPALATMLTAETYGDRVMGQSRTETVPTTALVLLSGNNLILKGDLPRRILKCRIDPHSDQPHRRHFNFDPAEFVRDHRQGLVAAALTILKWHLREPALLRAGAGRMASFEVWDDFVRQAVCRLAQLQLGGILSTVADDLPKLVDPMLAIDIAVQNDPTRTQHGRLLRAWAHAPMATPNCSTHGHPNCSRQDGVIMRGRW